MKKTERIIHLDDMFIYILKKWKLFIIMVVIAGVVFGGIGICKINEKYKVSEKKKKDAVIAVTVSKEETNSIDALLYLEQAISYQEDYNKNSILMKINPYEKKIASLKYQFQVSGETDPELRESRMEQGKKAYQCVFGNKEIYEFINKALLEEVDEKYLKELVSIEMESRGVINIVVMAPDEEMVQKIQGAIENFFLLYNKKILGNYKDLIVKLDAKNTMSVIDTGLQGIQTTQYNNPQMLQSQADALYLQLSSNAKEYLALAKEACQEGDYRSGQPLYKKNRMAEEIGIARRLCEAGNYAIKRVMVLMLLFIVYYALRYMWSSKLMYAYDFQDMYGLDVIDVLSVKDSGKNDLTVEKIFSRISDTGMLVLVSSSREQEILEVMKGLKLELENKKSTAYIITDPGSDDLLQLLKNPCEVIMVEGIGKSKYDKIKHVLMDIRSLGKSIKGTIVIKDIPGNK